MPTMIVFLTLCIAFTVFVAVPLMSLGRDEER
jgi:hypothetical protein